MDLTERIRVLIVDDDRDDLFITRRLLSKTRGLDCEIHDAYTFEEGLRAVQAQHFDVVLVDYRLGARSGLDMLRKVREEGYRMPLILLTGQGDHQVDMEAMAAGASDYLVKDEIDAHLLERSIRYARGRKRAEDRIHEQAALLDKARDAISAHDLAGNVIYWNKGAERLTKLAVDEVTGRDVFSRLCADDDPLLAEAWETVKTEGEWSGELHFVDAQGEEVIVDSRWTLVRNDQGEPRSILVISTDITERKKLETQFLRTQRMESIGRLVGGIAHDLGNLLAPIILGVKVLQARLEGEKVERTLDMIQKSAERGSEMVKQVLAFARGVEGERVVLNPAQIIQEVERITEETFPKSIEVETEIDEQSLWALVGDATQVQQVLVNLCVNARDAMPGGGQLEIAAENVAFDEADAQQNLEAEPGRFVCIAVHDNGTGIPAENLDKIFEPFYSTKASDDGTGLGLSTVYSIVKSHGGFIDVESDLGGGTSFYVYFPAAQPEQVAEPEQGEEPSFLREGRGERVLVVDDEDFILEMMTEALAEEGYEVLTASHGREALDVFDEHLVDAVITDLMMPKMDGVELIRLLKEQRPGVPVIAASALSGEKPEEAKQAGAQEFLPKPYTPNQLCAVIQAVIHSREEPA